MIQKKEKIIILIILVLTAILSFYPSLKELFSKQETIEEIPKSNYVTITITGEILVDKYTITLPYGSSYGNIIKHLKNVTNDYSIIESYTSICFTEDTTIVIKSTDISNEKEINTISKININTASKEELINIYGIGEKRADKIISYRQTKKIKSFEELKSLIGVSNEIIEKIKQQAVL